MGTDKKYSFHLVTEYKFYKKSKLGYQHNLKKKNNKMGEPVKSKTFLLKKHFVGLPREDDFEVVEKVLPPISDGEFLIETLYLSVDPYMRPYSRTMKEGTKMIG